MSKAIGEGAFKNRDSSTWENGQGLPKMKE